MADTLAIAIQDGTFPDNEGTLSSELNAASIPPLLESIQHAKDDLGSVVKSISKEGAGDIDRWIAQAKVVQHDIARCKEDARQIVEEHERVEALRSTSNESQSKVNLLENEIAFNEALQRQINSISDISSALNQVDSHIRQRQLIPASQALPGLMASINAIPSDLSRSLLTNIHADLSQTLTRQLKDELDCHCHVSVNNEAIQLSISGHGSQTTDDPSISIEDTLHSLERLSALQETQQAISKRIEACLLPHLHTRSKSIVVAAHEDGSTLRLVLSQERAQPLQMLEISRSLLRYIHDRAPPKLHDPLLHDVAALLLPQLVEIWLDTAIPVDLDQLKELDELQEQVKGFAGWLRDQNIKEADDLDEWVNAIPNTWLAKRRTTRQVERVERQGAEVEPEPERNTADDAWAENWADDEDSAKGPAQQSEETTDDSSDAWGFDTDDQAEQPQNFTERSHKEPDEEDGEAWGWGDDEDATAKPSPTLKKQPSLNANGITASRTQNGVDVLTEHYTITDIPDYILAQIGRDTLDLRTIQASPRSYFRSSADPAKGMQFLPMLMLAMFRAVAPTAYTDGKSFEPPLSTLNLYNDALYLAQRLEENPDLLKALNADIQILTKFARQIYSSELSIQRQILTDLLDNAQGFVGCTRQPNASVCETAVSSIVDYLRSLHAQWSSILSPSHLGQSIGSLLNTVMSKMIKEIEDMEDISEPESQKLLSFMAQISNLESLFTSPTANACPLPDQEEHLQSSIAVYVSSFFRFRYLEQILESSLVEIRYLWEEQGLSVEFSAEEVVDLIRALFAESIHRRNAIHAIRSGT
ncbi:ribosome biogenesis protein ytm1 [Exophiala xenobiotica]|uniref:Ribosome biogenesis protein ytm1 n=1 Tax=Lithohypha guttulata TaxID=1690604 RepID=A0ABR0KNI7_9EURO|nr:ribosome biogenesis protein ytm1 [Lithohypha guttulata]KAK5329175.1 ribosome biogenesis protein ytm1 [Exophiala xenobiotica]